MPKVLNKRNDKIPPEAILVDRSTKWGNPFKIGSPYKGHKMTREESLAEYANWLDGMVHNGRLDPDELRGKDLVCWDAPLPCHADILLEMANA